MFWAYYKSPQRVLAPGKPWPTILWLHGGPAGSGVGQGNFEEIGPLDVDLSPRNTTWLQKADLIFIDSPVGVGYSYVEDPNALASTDEQVAMDVVTLIKGLTSELPTLQSSPLYLVGVSYGAKHAAMVGASVARSIDAGSMNLTFAGIVLGGGWISPADFALSYPILLHSMSRLDDNAVPTAVGLGVKIQQQVAAGQFPAAYKTFQDLNQHINLRSAQVNLEDIMLDNTQTEGKFRPSTTNRLMNGIMHENYMIPQNVTWQVSLAVFDALTSYFMQPRMNEVEEVLKYGYQVAVYSGQLDLVCSTIGAEAWLQKLKWEDLHNFLSLPREALYYCDPPYLTVNAFKRSYKNLSFYWVLGAGHRVPVDQPCTALQMIGDIVKSPAI